MIAARRLGAAQIIVLGGQPARIELAKAFGATDIVNERGEEAVDHVRKLMGPEASPLYWNALAPEAMETAIGFTRAGGDLGRVGVPSCEGHTRAVGPRH